MVQNRDNAHELILATPNVLFIADNMSKMVAEFNARDDWPNQMLQIHLRVLLIYLSRLYTGQLSAHPITPDSALLKRYQSLIEEN